MTAPQEPIRLAFRQSIPFECECTWDYNIDTQIKSVKFLNKNCEVEKHRKAFDIAQSYREEIPVNLPKRGRGRPRVPGGQWHKKAVK